MKDALVQVEMDIPSLHSKATTTATLKKDNGLILQLESNIDIPKMSSLQTAIVRYGGDIFLLFKIFIKVYKL